MENTNHKKIIILIPTLEPDISFLSYINSIKEHDISDIIVVNDGSSTAYDSIFKTIALEGSIVLTHKENKGKGKALKTGIKYIQKNYNHFDCVVMVDSDGQHAVEDVIRVSKMSIDSPNSLTLGVRDFKSENIPFKSLLGNRLVSFIFKALYGKNLADTQTGLRAFTMPLISFMTNIKGERFEYEIQMLIDCIKNDIPIKTIPIKVIYNNDNEGTHYRSIADSIKIFKSLAADFTHFLISSFLSAIVDIGIAWFLLDFLLKYDLTSFTRILVATTIARFISIITNYLINLNFVFKAKATSNRSLRRYLTLSILLIVLSASGVYTLNTIFGISEKVGKILSDTLLFILSYRIQQKWVFKKRGDQNS